MWSRPRPRKPTHATRTVSLALASALERSAAPAEIAEPKKYRRSMSDSVVLFRACRVIAASNWVRDTKVDADAIHRQKGFNPSACVRQAGGAFVGQLGKLRPIVNRPTAAFTPDSGGSQPPRRLPACPTSRQRFHLYVAHPREIELSHRRRGRVAERRRAHGHGTRGEGRWDGDRVHGGGAGGYSAGSGVLPQRRNSALCAAAVGGVGAGPRAIGVKLRAG